MNPSPPAPPVAKKPRASKPKVKSGCLTCKQRRVKCDETKPACLRCSNFGRVCGGYPSKEETPPPKDPTPPVKRKLLSKAMQMAPAPSPSPEPSYAAVFAPPPPPISPFTPPVPAGIAFQDEREYQYFCHFRDATSMEFSNGFEPTLWNPFVLRACDNPSIRQLVVATAALSIAVKTPPLRLWNPSNDQHHQYALQQYGQALKGIREMVAAGQDSTRIALIGALLIFCFESLHGDLSRAMMHIRSAVDMIVKRLSSLPQPHYFSRVSSAATQSNAPIDNELLTAFMRIDRPSLALMGRQKGAPVIEANQIFNLLFSSEPLEMPNGFANTNEARVYLEDIIYRMLPSNVPPEDIPALWDEREGAVFSDFEWIPYQLKQWYQLSDLPNVSKHLCYRLAQWHDAFSPLLNYATSPVGDALFVPAAILHIQALAAELVITRFFPLSSNEHRSSSFSSARSSSFSDIHSGSFSGEASTRNPSLTVPEMSFVRPRASSQRSSPAPSFGEVNLFPTVHAILDFSRRLTAHPRFSKGFVFDIGIIAPLSMVSMMCPDKALRRETIDVLRSMAPRREGMWDSRVCAEAGDRYLTTEDTQANAEMIDPLLLV
ncbi:hypothetical protein EG329_004032 [Mollisiaceae sp. DMI_Dod_QoI]|nr:hypothetical protein EG329_004032 [Helotiales sp. DMI_Dod_QoI]